MWLIFLTELLPLGISTSAVGQELSQSWVLLPALVVLGGLVLLCVCVSYATYLTWFASGFVNPGEKSLRPLTMPLRRFIATGTWLRFTGIGLWLTFLASSLWE